MAKMECALLKHQFPVPSPIQASRDLSFDADAFMNPLQTDSQLLLVLTFVLGTKHGFDANQLALIGSPVMGLSLSGLSLMVSAFHYRQPTPGARQGPSIRDVY